MEASWPLRGRKEGKSTPILRDRGCALGVGHLKGNEATRNRGLGMPQMPASRFNFRKDGAGTNQISLIIFIGGLPNLEGLRRTSLGVV
jgi:hypothetical protein